MEKKKEKKKEENLYLSLLDRFYSKKIAVN